MENGLVVKQEVDFYDGEELMDHFVSTYEHDDKGNVLVQTQADQDGENAFYYRFEYIEFDQQNNWTKKLQYDSKDAKEPVGLVIRTYQYFEE